MEYGLVLCAAVGAAVAAGCVQTQNEDARFKTPERHRMKQVMGRDLWRVLSKYYEYGWPGKEAGTDNPEVQNHPAVADAMPCYVAFGAPPGDDSEYTTWPHLKDNFTAGSPALEIIDSNPQPDRPFSIANWSERRGKMTWGSPVTLDREEYARWRAKHPNLLTDGHLGEWCNDIDLAYGAFAGKNDTSGCSQPTKSEKRKAAFRKFFEPRPKTRYEQYDLLKRYYEMRRERNYGGTMSVLDAHLNTLHIAADFGASIVKLETTCSGQYRYQPSAMFIRGAARQFGIPWQWYIAGYVNGYAKNGEFLGDAMCRYPLDPDAKPPYTRYSPNVVKASCWPTGQIRIGNSGPDFGISRSLFTRTHYLAYLSGANFIALEEWRDVVKIWDFEKKKTVFSPRGRIYCEFVDFTRDHPDRGVHYSPVAICVPIAQGYPTWGGSPFAKGAFGYTKGDEAVDAVFFTLVPGVDYSERIKKGDELCLRNSPFANMYDVIAPDAKSQSVDEILNVMKSYKALVVAGDYPDAKAGEALKRYEAEGGKVFRVDEAMLADVVKSGKGRSVWVGEVRYPQVERLFAELQREHFPFKVEGDCLFGATRTEKGWWLYVFNNRGVTKFAQEPEVLDPKATSHVKVTLKSTGRTCEIDVPAGQVRTIEL